VIGWTSKKWYLNHMNIPNPPTPRVLSCGILVRSPEGWFLAHATRTPRWDIPKGRVDAGETPMQTALREALEETGVDLSEFSKQLQDHGQHPYIPKKDLHLFTLDVETAFDLSHCCCSTNVVMAHGEYPETDRWEWVPVDQVRNRLGKGMISYMEARGLLDPLTPTPTIKSPRP
jgi:8-oxo-dGTP pyrophosphatase MutT (NUDIX family)